MSRGQLYMVLLCNAVRSRRTSCARPILRYYCVEPVDAPSAGSTACHPDAPPTRLKNRFLRAQPPTIKVGSSLDAGRRKSGGLHVERNATAAAPAAATAAATGTKPADGGQREAIPAATDPGGDEAPMSSASAPAGGLILNAPGVVSKNICEREVKPPAPMRIGGFGGGFGGSFGGGGRGAIGKGDKRHLGAGAGAGTAGGFPAVRHRSEMGLVKLGGNRATPASSSAAALASRQPTGVGNKGGGAEGRGGSTSSGGGGGGSSLGTGGGIPGDIHEENLSRVSAMTQEEIAEAQQEIRAALSPEALEMLMRRGRGGGGRVKGAAARAAPAAAPAAAEIKEDKQVAGVPGPPAGVAGATSTAAAACATRAAAAASAAAAATAGPPKATSGAPTGAQRAATAAGGVDSEEALEAALLTLPPEERAKSSWTLSAADAAAPPAAASGGGGQGRGEARVDLDGAAVPAAAEAEATGGEGSGALHHHGDDPEKAGYTPSELVRLARWVHSGGNCCVDDCCEYFCWLRTRYACLPEHRARQRCSFYTNIALISWRGDNRGVQLLSREIRRN